MSAAVKAWFEAHDAYHKASDAYNERLKLVRAERERGNWSMTTDDEYRALGDAQGSALRASEMLYQALRAEQPKPQSRRADWHYDSQGYCDNPGRGY